jgi:hypothetical protein
MSTCPKPEPFVLDPKTVFVRTSHGTGISRYEPVDPVTLYPNEWAKWTEWIILDHEAKAVDCDLVDVPDAFGRYVHRANRVRLRRIAFASGRTAEFTDCPPAIDPAGAWAMMSVSARES